MAAQKLNRTWMWIVLCCHIWKWISTYETEHDSSSDRWFSIVTWTAQILKKWFQVRMNKIEAMFTWSILILSCDYGDYFMGIWIFAIYMTYRQSTMNQYAKIDWNNWSDMYHPIHRKFDGCNVYVLEGRGSSHRLLRVIHLIFFPVAAALLYSDNNHMI